MSQLTCNDGAAHQASSQIHHDSISEMETDANIIKKANHKQKQSSNTEKKLLGKRYTNKQHNDSLKEEAFGKDSNSGANANLNSEVLSGSHKDGATAESKKSPNYLKYRQLTHSIDDDKESSNLNSKNTKEEALSNGGDDDKMEKRLIQNRLAAKKCRIKKKEQFSRVNQDVKQLADENKTLKSQLNEMSFLLFKKMDEVQQTNKKLERVQVQHTIFLTNLLLTCQNGQNTQSIHRMVQDHFSSIQKEYQKPSLSVLSPENDKAEEPTPTTDSLNLSQQLISMIKLCQNKDGEQGEQNRQPSMSDGGLSLVQSSRSMPEAPVLNVVQQGSIQSESKFNNIWQQPEISATVNNRVTTNSHNTMNSFQGATSQSNLTQLQNLISNLKTQKQQAAVSASTVNSNFSCQGTTEQQQLQLLQAANLGGLDPQLLNSYVSTQQNGCGGVGRNSPAQGQNIMRLQYPNLNQLTKQ